MDVGRAFTYLFRDPRWARKLGIATLLAAATAALRLLDAWGLDDRFLVSGPLAPTVSGAISGLASVPLSGFALRIMQRVTAGTDLPLPEWSDLGGITRDGLKLWAVVTLWGLPATLARLAGDALSPGPGDGPPSLRGIVLLVTLVVLVVQPAAEARLATTGSVAAGLDVGTAFRVVGRNLGGYLLLLVVVGLGAAVWFGLSMSLVWLAWRTVGGQPGVRDILNVGIAVAILFPYFQFVLYHLYGQAYRRANRGPTPFPEHPSPTERGTEHRTRASASSSARCMSGAWPVVRRRVGFAAGNR